MTSLSHLCLHTRSPHGRRVSRPVSFAGGQQASSQKAAKGVQAAKEALKLQILGTCRGGAASALQRGQVAEAQANLESLGQGIQLSELQGLWRLIYTTAPDVGPILAAGGSAQLTGLLPLQTGNIYQRFSSQAQGLVENIIQLSVPFLLEPDQGVTVCVKADWTACSPRRVQLRFQEAGASRLRISDALEALIAPALLPRTWLTQQILLALREFQFRIQFRTPGSSSESLRQSFGSDYLFTFLDQDMLIGRQTGSGGIFIFQRAPDTEIPPL